LLIKLITAFILTTNLVFGNLINNYATNSLINNNSQIISNNMLLNVNNDANLNGANVKANDSLKLDVGNNLNLVSLRDEYSFNNKGSNVSLGGGSGSFNAGMSNSNGTTTNKQTVLSSIIASKVDVNVKNNTYLKASLLASGEYDSNKNFIDNKTLNFNTNTLNFENSSNNSYSSNRSLGANVGYSSNNKQISSVGYQASNSLNVNSSKTLATLGQGNINIKDIENSSELTRLNTNTLNINKDLYSSSTGTKVDATLDTRLLTEDGRKSIAEDIERTKRLGQAIGDVVSSDALKTKDTFDHISDVQKDLDVQKALALNDKGKTIDILENQENYSQEQIDSAVNDYAQMYAKIYKVNIEDAKMAMLQGKYGSTYTNADNTSSNIYLDKDLNQNALKSASTMGHEVAHVRQNQGQTYLRENKDLQEEYSGLFEKYSSSGLEFSSYTYNNVKLNNNILNPFTPQQEVVLNQNSVVYKKDKSNANMNIGRMDDKLNVEKIKGEDKKYKVVGGELDGTKDVFDENNRLIANTITEYSGFNQENKPVIGAILDMNDTKGKEFLDGLDEKSTNIKGIYTYFQNATSEKENDYKTQGARNDEEKKSGVYHNRLSPIDGTLFAPKDLLVPTVATARDIGNIGAGFMAGKMISTVSSRSVGTGIIASTTELPWIATRLGFDGYNLYSNFKFKYDDYKLDIHLEISEPPVSTRAQKVGFDVGNPKFKIENTYLYKKYEELKLKYSK